MSWNDLIVDYGVFLSSFNVKPNGAMSFLVGSGISVQSGIPTGGQLVWEFKREIFCRETRTHRDSFSDLSLQKNQVKLQAYFDSKGEYPKLYAPEEYSFYFKKCYPMASDRELFIQNLVKDKKPSLGHLCLGVLAQQKKVTDIWTTNFDDLIEAGMQNVGTSPVLISDATKMTLLKTRMDMPYIYKLHGDFRYDSIKNTLEEVQKLEEYLLKHFLLKSKDSGLVVLGYSGCDESIMSTLEAAVDRENAYSYGLYWALKDGQQPNERVIKLIKKHKIKNMASGFIIINTADSFLYDLYSICGGKNDALDNRAVKLFEMKKAFMAPKASKQTDLVKLNAYHIVDFPETAYCFDTDLKWKEFKELKKDEYVSAFLTKGKAYVFGELNAITHIFHDHICSDIQVVDLNKSTLYGEDSLYVSLIYEALGKILEKSYNLKCSHNLRRYWNDKWLIEKRRDMSAFEAIEFQIQYLNGKLWLVLLPTVHIEPNLKVESYTNYNYQKQVFVNSIISKRYNRQCDEILKKWHSLLFGDQYCEKRFVFVEGFEFVINPLPSYGGNVDRKGHYFRSMFILPEPELSFSVSNSSERIIHPLKGLLNWGPLDYSYNLSGRFQEKIQLAIIAPKNYFERLTGHLEGLEKSINPFDEKDYLIEYPGFERAFKKKIVYPTDPGSCYCILFDDSILTKINIMEFYEKLKKAIKQLKIQAADTDVLVIYLPDEYSHFRNHKNEGVYFDLHDSIKLYCAKEGIKVQFIEDKSIEYKNQARVRWWLSLGLYAKSSGNIWDNTNIDDGTAFIGIGYAVLPNGFKDKFVVGCSQVFDSKGRGIKVLLQPISKYYWRKRNPYMSTDDARRLLYNLKQAYYDAEPVSDLKRIVIHKSTPFKKEEMDGFIQAAEGIASLELLQIQTHNCWRGFQGTRWVKNGKECMGIDLFPVRRGTVIQLDDFKFIMWTHGNLKHKDIAGGKLNYYQNKRGIPSPLLVKRFYGNATIETVASEIMALTKMNWNSGSLYKTLPATLDFSKTLSRIAKQEENISEQMYDFRFFI